MVTQRDRVTEIFAGMSRGQTLDKSAVDEVLPLLYGELRRMAQWHLDGAGGQTLQATALVHEAYLKLVDQPQVEWRGRTQFFALAAKVMRHVVVDHVRKQAAAKRGGGWQRITLAEGVAGQLDLDLEQLLSLDAALVKLEALDEREAQVVDLRFFGGLKVHEVAEVMEVSKRSVEGYWSHARAWLRRELSQGDIV